MSIFAIPFLLIFPGYLITIFLSSISGFFKRLAFSVVLSVSLEVVLSYLLVFFNSSLIHYFLLLMTGIILILLVLGWKLESSAGLKGNGITNKGMTKIMVIVKEWKALQKKEKIFFVVILTLSLAVGIFVFYPHFQYLWPIHADEWWDVSAVESVLQGRPLNTNPYLLTPYPDYKPGFTSLLAGVFSGGIEPVKAWAYLPALNLFMISFIVSLLLYDKTKNFWVAGLVPLFLAAIRSNAYVLGWWFFVPSMFALLFVLFLLLTVEDLLKNFWSGLVIVGVISASLGLVYLPFLGFLFLSFIPLIPKLFQRFPVVFIIVLFLVIISIITLLFLSPYKSFWPQSAPLLLKSFFVPIDATPAMIKFLGFFKVVPIVLFLLAICGFWFLRKTNWSKSLLTAGIMGLVFLLIIYFGGISFLAFYQREFYFLGVVVAILASVGCGTFLLKVKMPNILRWFAAALVIFMIFWGYFNLPGGTLLYYLVTPADFKALTWLKSQSNLQNMRVLSNAFTGTIVTPLSGLPVAVAGLTSQGVGIGNDLMQSSSFFNTTNCTIKKNIMIVFNAQIVYGNIPQNCSFLKEVYAKDGIFIYKRVL